MVLKWKVVYSHDGNNLAPRGWTAIGACHHLSGCPWLVGQGHHRGSEVGWKWCRQRPGQVCCDTGAALGRQRRWRRVPRVCGSNAGYHPRPGMVFFQEVTLCE